MRSQREQPFRELVMTIGASFNGLQQLGSGSRGSREAGSVSARYPALMTRRGQRPGPEASPDTAPHRLLPRPTTSRVKRRISASLTK